jgi:hypothetical protein
MTDIPPCIGRHQEYNIAFIYLLEWQILLLNKYSLCCGDVHSMFVNIEQKNI